MKDDAVPTLFDYNKDKHPQKRRSSLAREQSVTQMQLFDEALEHHGKCQKFEQELNTKSMQTINISKSVGTQALPETKDTGIQTIETFSNTWNNTLEYDCDVSDEEPPHDLDSSFIAT